MVTRSTHNAEEEVCLEVELLNQTCLDLVAQIEQLKKENTRLKKMQKKGNQFGRRKDYGVAMSFFKNPHFGSQFV
jgi:hypothetical protein